MLNLNNLNNLISLWIQHPIIIQIILDNLLIDNEWNFIVDNEWNYIYIW